MRYYGRIQRPGALECIACYQAEDESSYKFGYGSIAQEMQYPEYQCSQYYSYARNKDMVKRAFRHVVERSGPTKSEMATLLVAFGIKKNRNRKK